MIGTFEQMIQDMKAGVFDYTNDGACSNCGECCTDILPVSEKEIQRIRQYIKKNRIKEQKRFIPTVVPVVDYTCPFRDNSGRKCVIYKVRPRICRDFKCDNPRKGITPDLTTYDPDTRPISMRMMFYGRG